MNEKAAGRLIILVVFSFPGLAVDKICLNNYSPTLDYLFMDSLI
jgi:hypothetical protein